MSRIIDQVLEFHIPCVKVGEIHPDMKLEDLGVDSLDCIEICMDIEEKLAIMITDEELIRIICVNDIYELVDAKQKEKPVNDHLVEKPKDENSLGKE